MCTSGYTHWVFQLLFPDKCLLQKSGGVAGIRWISYAHSAPVTLGGAVDIGLSAGEPVTALTSSASTALCQPTDW